MIRKVTGRFRDPQVDLQFDRLIYVLNQIIALLPEANVLFSPAKGGRALLETVDQRYLLSFGRYATARGYEFLDTANPVVDPGFEQTAWAGDATYWTFDGAKALWEAGSGVGGSDAARLADTATLASKTPIAATSGQYVLLRVKAKRDAAWRGSFTFYLDCLDGSQASLSYQVGSAALTADDLPEADYQEFACFVQPVNASLAYVVPTISVQRTSTSGSVWVDDVSLVVVPDTIARPDTIFGATWNMDLMARVMLPTSIPSVPRPAAWSTDLAFNSAAADALSWSSGTLYRGDEAFALSAGSVTGMVDGATYYVYLDEEAAGPPYSLAVTTNASEAVGAKRLVIAAAQKNTKSGATKCLYYVFGGSGGASPLLTADNIAANAITGNEIAANAISAGHIGAGAVTADKIGAGAVTADKIGAGAVTADKIAADAVTADKINVTDLAAVNANTGNLTVTGQVKSSNYSPGSAGFSINSDGTAEFNNVSIRGSIEAGTTGYANLADKPPLAQSLWVPPDGELFAFSQNLLGSKGTNPL